ncbi:hypothetical protein K438DRAFT_1746717 [Mycena galopus ATCC 62051]|nr:hypothetical protein K438DRAFT_1746717 [Mycena galopus ATCC 62051]
MRFTLFALPFAFMGAVSAAILRFEVDLIDQSLDGGASMSSFKGGLSSLELGQTKVSAQCKDRNSECSSDFDCCSRDCKPTRPVRPLVVFNFFWSPGLIDWFRSTIARKLSHTQEIQQDSHLAQEERYGDVYNIGADRGNGDK